MAVLIVGLLAAACVRTVKTVVPVPAERTVESVVQDLGPSARARWAPLCHAVGLDYPPPQLALLAFKRERRLEIWGRQNGPWVPIDAIPVLAASGFPGPKLREGDGQVPEGFYRIVAFNPNSRYHLSLMLDYPNADDLIEGERDGRTDLGGEIFVHGGARSIGCLAVGDYARPGSIAHGLRIQRCRDYRQNPRPTRLPSRPAPAPPRRDRDYGRSWK